MSFLPSKEIAKLWAVKDDYVARQCRAGKIPGAYKYGRTWMVPANTPKPHDGRMKNPSGNYQDIQSTEITRKPLPIGISDYRVASQDYYYIDKTLLIKEFLDERPMVSLFTRPRRFGKTLTMDMLRTFFEKTDEDTSKYFRDKKIWACGENYRKYQGKYPVIFLTFKDIKCETWEKTYELITRLIIQEYRRHSVLESNATIINLDYYQKISSGNASSSDYMMSLQYLSQMLHQHYGIAPIIIIDEYDTPIQQGHTYGFYDSVILFMRNLFSGGLKDNKHLSYGFLTGILRVAKESIFSGLNNLKINSILDNKYSQYFGFTADEVQQMAEVYGVPEKFDELKAWYDGYRFGRTELFNPWSVINYFNNECEPRAFWQSTGSNEIIGEILANADTSVYDRLHALLEGKSFTTTIDTSVIYPQIKKKPSSIYSFLLVAGYLKILSTSTSASSDYMCTVSIPNKEISLVYKKEILSQLEDLIPPAISDSIREALYCSDANALQQLLHRFLMETVSSFDTAKEIFYHGLVLGICAMMENQYVLRSNRESGLGRFDIQLTPKDAYRATLPGILIELKAEKDKTPSALAELAQAALKQINEKAYDTDMKALGIQTVYKYGVAFSGKNVEVAVE